jgi:hypothetical protein
MPTTDTRTVTIPTGVQSFKVYDDGGATGYYSSNCDGALVLTAPVGYVLQLSGRIVTQSTDQLTVYDGSTADGTPLIDAVSSTGYIPTWTTITTVVSSGQSMRLYFSSDGSLNYIGLDLTVTVSNLTGTITLADNASNVTAISAAAESGGKYDVTLSGRTLYKDGNWNTLCLPFDVTIAGSVLDGDGVDVRTLSSSRFEDGTLTLNFTDISPSGEQEGLMEAGKPYIIRWSKPDGYTADGGYDITDPVFSGVTVSSTVADVSTDYVDFCGTFSPEEIYESTDAKHNLYLGADNTLYYPTAEGYHVNAFRGWFQLKKGLTCGEPKPGSPNSVRAFSLNFDGEETGIKSLTPNPGLTPNPSPKGEGNFKGEGSIYTLNGVKVEKPVRKGLYIQNGKKVVIK